ncbi:hypothetical protein ACJK20_04880 [Enterococcus faecium]
MSDGILGLIGVFVSLAGTIGISIYNQKKIKEQNSENEETQRIILTSQKDFEVQMLVRQQEFQEKLTQKQIDANLKAKARIEWINGVRQKSSEFISLLLSLQKDEVVFQEQWLKVEEVSELLKLFFNTSEKKQIEAEIYVKNNKIILGNEGKRVLYNENDNKNKHIYIRRYIKCLIELYQSGSYQHILKSRKDVFKVFKNSSLKEADYIFNKGIDSEEKAKQKLDESDLADYLSNKINLESNEQLYVDLTKRLINYHEAIDNFSEIIGIYLKIEWDKAKEGE